MGDYPKQRIVVDNRVIAQSPEQFNRLPTREVDAEPAPREHAIVTGMIA
jgi:hypothetical protein